MSGVKTALCDGGGRFGGRWDTSDFVILSLINGFLTRKCFIGSKHELPWFHEKIDEKKKVGLSGNWNTTSQLQLADNHLCPISVSV